MSSLFDTAVFIYNNYNYIISIPLVYQGFQNVIIVYNGITGIYRYFIPIGHIGSVQIKDQIKDQNIENDNIQVLDTSKDIILVESAENDEWSLIRKLTSINF